MTQLDIRQLAEQGGVNPIAPVTVPEAVKFEDGADLNTAIGSIATIETSPATVAHAVGDFIVWNGQLYTVTAAIAIGETLAVNTNITSTNVGSELTALNAGLTTIKIVSYSTSVTSQSEVLTWFRENSSKLKDGHNYPIEILYTGWDTIYGYVHVISSGNYLIMAANRGGRYVLVAINNNALMTNKYIDISNPF